MSASAVDGIGWVPYSDVPGLAWPAVPPPRGRTVLNTQFQLDHSQWLAPEALLDRQHRQLRRLLRFAVDRSAYFRHHPARAGIADLDALTFEDFLRWPVLTKSDIQRHADELLVPDHPERLGEIHLAKTSGSTGHPLRAAVSGTSAFFNRALQLRGHLWYGLDLSAKLAVIRSFIPDATNPDWQPPFSLAFRTGPLVTLSSLEDFRIQLKWLRDHAPRYLITNNGNLRALIEAGLRHDLAPTSIRIVIGFADLAVPDLSALTAKHWNARYLDVYSCNEIGVIALQCPSDRHFHVQSEHVHLEILRSDGTPCAPGEVGRVVVTDLHNFAMPLIRYELGDQAAFGPPCACGRGLPTLQTLAGRTRDLAIDPTGRRFSVHLNSGIWTDIAPIIQRQIVQTGPGTLEIRYVADRELSDAETGQLRAEIRLALRFDYAVHFVRMTSIPLGPGGKFNEFVSAIDR